MTRSSRWIRTLSVRFCAPRTIERLIEPILTDIELERCEALQNGARWRARWILLRGHAGLAKAAALHGLRVCSWRMAPDEQTTRIVAFSLASFVVVTVALMLPPLLALAHRGRITTEAPYLIPQAIPLSLPLAIAFGIAGGWFRHHPVPRTVRRLMIVGVLASASSLATMQWLVPAANQAFRVAVMREIAPWSAAHMPRGLAERSFTELFALLREPDPNRPTFETMPDYEGLDDVAREGPIAGRQKIRLHIQSRLALSAVPIAFSLLAVAIARTIRRRALARGIFAGSIIIYVGVFLTQLWIRTDQAPATPWMPNIGVAAVSLLLLLRSRATARASV